MIRTIFSTLDTFKTLKFTNGLNVLVSEKTAASTQKQTRNRAGKTSLIELLHFLLGGDCPPDSIFRNTALIDHTFGMILDVGEQTITVRRSGKKPAEIHTGLDFNFDAWPHQPNAKGVISNEHWRDILAQEMFGIAPDIDSGAWSPKFRQLITYFVRKQSSGGFVSPFKQAHKQFEGDSQVALSYLLGLDWTVSQQWQLVRDRERMLREIKKSANTEGLGSIVGDPAELRTELAVSEQRVSRMRKHVQSFNVVPEYRDLENEANTLTSQLAVWSDENTLDRGLVSELDAAIETARIPSYSDLEELYREVGIQLPDLALKQFEELENFHRSITDNRRAYLQGELDEAHRRIEERERQKVRLDERRREVMTVLRVGGALDQYVRLQSELTNFEQHTAALRTKLETAEYLLGQQAELNIERTRLRLRLQQDLREQKARVDEAITTFEDVSSKLYEKAGSLIIEDTQNGPKFDVRIQGQRSTGVSSMQIFSFDVTLTRLAIERGVSPGFLVHDSHVFDAADPRQTLNALQVGSEMSKSYGFQYLVTLNSNTLSTDDGPKDFDVWQYVNGVRLTDATDDGGIFGIRFD